MTLPKLTDYSTFEDETLPFADTDSDDAENATATEKNGGKKKSLAVWIQVTVILILLVCVLCGAFSAAAVQVLDGAIPEFELNAWRFFIQWLMVVPVVLYKRTPIRTAVRNVPILGCSIFLVNVLNVVMYTTYIYLPLGLADGLMNAVVLSGNALLSICIKDDRKCALYVGAGLCVVGFVLMMQPGFMFSGLGLPPPPVTNWTSSCKNNLTAGHSHDPSDPMGYVYAILTALVLIGSFHSIGKMVEVLDPFTFSFWNGILGTGASCVLMLIFETPTFLPSAWCVFLLLVHCVGTTVLEVSRPNSLQYIRPSVCAMVHSSKMAFMVLLQYTILSDIKPGLHNWLELFGAALSFLGMLGGPLTEIIKARAQQ